MKFIDEVAVFVQVHILHHILVRLSDLICFPNRFSLRQSTLSKSICIYLSFDPSNMDFEDRNFRSPCARVTL